MKRIQRKYSIFATSKSRTYTSFMKTILLTIVSLFLSFFFLVDQSGKAQAATFSAEVLPELHSSAEEEISAPSLENFRSDLVSAPGANTANWQVRPFHSRQPYRPLPHSHQVRKRTKMLSDHLTTLINHITLNYTTIRIPCWQYASDCYVFAYRHILI